MMSNRCWIRSAIVLSFAFTGGCSDSALRPDSGVAGRDSAVVNTNPDAKVCAEVNVSLSAATPSVVLLIDKSGSMTESFGATNRWKAVYNVLMDKQTGLVAQFEEKVRFGLMLYTSDYGFGGGTCPILTEVPIALNNYQAMNAVYEPIQLVDEGDTPTGESIDAAADRLKKVTDPGSKVIILATDGVPDTCAEPDGNGEQVSKTAAKNAYEAGISTSVISVGADISQSHLQEMANVGAGLAAKGSEKAPYFQALDATQLLSAFNQILGNVRTCEFTIDGSIENSYAGQGKVVLDGLPLAYSTEWTLTDDSTLEVLGTACTTIMAGGDHTLTATFPCAAIVH
jgi:hypothetical protein